MILTDEKTTATIDNTSGKVCGTPKEIKLKTIDDVRLEMATCYRAMKSGKIEASDGTRLVYVLAQIGKMIEIADIERRITTLENLQIEKGV